MPKIHDTRKQRAIELLRKMREGPSIGMPGEKLTREEISEQYRIWVQSWIIYEIIQLVPELRAMHKKHRINYFGEPTTNEKTTKKAGQA